MLVRGFSQWQHKFTDELTFSAGVHAMFFRLTNEFVVEPRMSLQWTFHPKQSFNIGYGEHSQMQPKIVYFTKTYDDVLNRYWETNHDVKFTKSNHYVVGYNYLINNDLRLKFETYYQSLYKVPISGSMKQFSMLNAGDDFGVPEVDSLINKGKGRNCGAELTFEKFLSKGYYFLITASVFDANKRKELPDVRY